MHRSNSPSTHGLLEDHCQTEESTKSIDCPAVQQQTHPDPKLQGAHNSLGCHSTTRAASLGVCCAGEGGEAIQQSELIKPCLLLCSLCSIEKCCRHPGPDKPHEDELSLRRDGRAGLQQFPPPAATGHGLKHLDNNLSAAPLELAQVWWLFSLLSLLC